MIKTTRIKYSQAPRIIVDDLSPQCDGIKQTFTLSRPVPEWAPYCLVFNGQLYTNTSYKQWFVLDEDRKTIHTSFITPPTQGPNKSLILIVGVAGMEDLGVTWDDIVGKPEFPTVNNATLTIQKNGVTVDTFTANSDSDVTADITVPTKTSDITNDLNFLTSSTLPIAGSNTLGAVSVGAGLTISSGGVLSATGGGVADAVAWGNITGTLADQDDLQEELDGKQDSLSTAQLNAVNSGVTSEKVSTYDGYAAIIAGKADDVDVPVITMQTTDPGEGVPLAANHFIAVYVDEESE